MNSEEEKSLGGFLLLASPSLEEASFYRSVVLLSSHTQEQGAFGVIINRPCGRTLGEVDERFVAGPLADVPLFDGGPVSDNQVMLAVWKCSPQSGTFKFLLGLDEEKLLAMISADPELQMRAYLGYSGWSAGQLEGELAQNAWVVTAVDPRPLAQFEGQDLWQKLLKQSDPRLALLPDYPDDPSLN